MVLFSFNFSLVFSQAPTYNWNTKHQVNGSNESSLCLAIDTLNKFIYSCGYLESAATFSNLNISEMNFGGGNGSRDGYLAKHDFNGNLIWAVNMGSTSDDATYGVNFALDGNIYVTGYYQNTMHFKSIGSSNFTLTSSSGNKDVFIASYNSNGKFRWARRGGGTSDDIGYTITSTKNSVVIMGSYKNSASFGIYSTTALYNNKGNHFISAYDFKGNGLWLAEAKSDNDDDTGDPFIYSHSKIISSNDTLFIIGKMGGTNMTFINSGGSSFGTVLTNNNGNENICYASLSSTGNWFWARTIQTNGNPQYGYGLAADCRAIYIAGSIHPTSVFPSTYTLASGDHDVPFLAKCSKTNGVDNWVNFWASSAGHEDFVSSVQTDSKGYVYIAGNFRSNNFKGLGLANGTEIFVSKYQSNGTLVWDQAIKGNNNNYVTDFSINGNKIFITGQYENDITLPGTALTTGDNSANIFLGRGTLVSDPLIYNCCTSPPSIAVVSGNQNLCSLGSTTISANTPIIGSGNWFIVEGANSTGSGTLTNPAVPTNTVTGLSIGANIYSWVITNKNCNPSIDTLKVFNASPPTVANAGSNKVICINNPTVTMNANVPAVGTGSWTVITGTGTIANPTLATTAVTGIASGTNIFQWTITSGSCAPSSSTVSIQVDQMPSTSIAGPSQTVCAATSSVMLGGNIPAVGTGSWTLVSGAGSITTPTLSNTTVTGLGVPSNVFRWAISNGVCPSNSSSVTIIVDKLPSTALAGANQSLCISSPSTTLAANTPTSGTGLWTLLSGTATITTPTLESTSVTGLTVGTHILQWSITSGSCPPSTSTMSIRVDQIPTVSLAGPNATVCTTSYTMAGNTPAIGTGSWTLISGSGGIASPTSPSTAVNFLNTGVNVFQWRITNGVCTASSSTMSITYNPPPSISNAGASQTICASNPSTSLAGNTPTTGTGLWTVVSGTASIINPTLATSGVTGIGTGITVLQWSISNPPCASSNSTMSIKVDPVPTLANAGTNQTICATSYTLFGNNPLIGMGTWSLISGSGTITAPSNPSTTVTGLGPGLNVFQWQISNGSCTPSTSTVSIFRFASPTTASAGANQTVCISNPTTTLSGNTPITGSGMWTVGSGTATVTNPTLATSGVTGIGNGTTTLIWTISNGTCPPSTSTMTIFTDQVPSIAIAGSNQSICASSYSLAGNTPSIGTGVWSLISGTASITSPTMANSPITGLGVGTSLLQWSISNGVCASSTSTVSITRDDDPTLAVAGSNQTLCASNPTYTMIGNIPTVGTGSWTVVSGLATISSPTSGTTSVIGISTGINIFQWEISNGVCLPSISSMTIQVDDNPTKSLSAGDQTVCITNSSVTLNGTVPTVGSGIWSILSGTATIVTPTLATTSVTNIALGTNILEWSITNGVCAASTSTMAIYVDQIPSTSIAGPNGTVCISNPSIGISANSPTVGVGMWTVITGTGTITSPTSNVTQVSGLSLGSNIIQWEISNGVCNSSISTLTVSVDDVPSIANAGSNQTICASNPTITMTGNTPTVGIGNWSFLVGSGVISNPNLENTTVTLFSNGTSILEWQISNGVCLASTSTVTIDMDIQPTISNAGSSQTLCINNPSLTLSGNTPIIGSGLWTVLSGTASINTPTIENSTVTSIGLGITILEWTISNGVCAPSTSTMSIQVDQLSDNSNAGPDQTICSNAVNLSGNIPLIGNGIWTILNGSGIINNNTLNSSSVTNLSIGLNSFIWSVTNGVCPNNSDTVDITVLNFPDISVTMPDYEICEADTLFINANNPMNGLGTWSIVQGTGSINNTNSNSTFITGFNYGVNIVRWTISNSPCPSEIDDLTITVYQAPTISYAGSDQIVYSEQTNLEANVPSIGSGKWINLSPENWFSNINSHNSQVNNLVNGENKLIWQISNGVCPTSQDTVIIYRESVVIPSAFSPNGDYMNDHFFIQGIESLGEVEINVFNRWGNLVYSNKNYKNDWAGNNLTGEKLSDDTYYFTLKTNQKKEIVGYVMIKR